LIYVVLAEFPISMKLLNVVLLVVRRSLQTTILHWIFGITSRISVCWFYNLYYMAVVGLQTLIVLCKQSAAVELNYTRYIKLLPLYNLNAGCGIKGGT
jgi:hypothetical protein